MTDDKFSILLKEYSGKAMRIALCITRNEDDAKDAFQDAATLWWKKIERFKDDPLFDTTTPTFFYTEVRWAAMQVCRQRGRSQRNRDTNVLPSVVDSAPDANAQSPADACADTERDELFSLAIAKLKASVPSEHFECWHLNRFDEVTMAEIAVRAGISEDTVGTWVFRTTAKLREIVRRMGM